MLKYCSVSRNITTLFSKHCNFSSTTVTFTSKEITIFMLKCNNFCLKTSPLFSLSFLFSRKTLQLFFQVFFPFKIL